MSDEQDDSPTFHADDVEMKATEIAHKGYFRLDRHWLRHKRYDGGWTEPFQREVFERGHAVAVLPYDPVRDQVVLIDQFRIGAYTAFQQLDWFGDNPSPWLAEIVAGIVEPGETPEQVATREIVEEIGIEAREIRKIRTYLATPGGSSESLIIYAARVDAAGAGGVHGLSHEHEDIRAYAVPATEAIAMIDNGRMINATAIIALEWLRNNREALRADWL
ncbi:NUDIX domain-containing protein [Magnetospira sp. QH-2]|uniref:NUDIX domain-containing protein n=1 Tax=Magnetospira sp. (strain QH-2) TaxID=1288970 RepID=UPI0003E80BE4|nr:NUDIX domain-containing protein [Magnetospira sp. QH-2]CCQ73504.1 ADP-ribose pyrophosphatase [Magnetospira sp. QH-2]